jgi:hypothetical protein
MAEGDFAGGNVDIISKDYKGKVLKINIGSKVNTNAITEANFKLQKDLMWFYKKSIQITLTQFNYSSLQMKEYTCRFLLWNI